MIKSARVDCEKICVLIKALFCRNTLCIARKSDEIRALIFRKTPQAIYSAFTWALAEILSRLHYTYLGYSLLYNGVQVLGRKLYKTIHHFNILYISILQGLGTISPITPRLIILSTGCRNFGRLFCWRWRRPNSPARWFQWWRWRAGTDDFPHVELEAIPCISVHWCGGAIVVTNLHFCNKNYLFFDYSYYFFLFDWFDQEIQIQIDINSWHYFRHKRGDA